MKIYTGSGSQGEIIPYVLFVTVIVLSAMRSILMELL
ncbi:hypothetical protein Zm00014a_040630 [Zea mays]|jgi:hypothetical protein|uniref:Uncharacterized protein n=1 Tax=Zea mays TaxID=4577 RepID=A0A3L6D8H7_MAIZE|nr:hypothetical protein Zm00014a_040630 [Zea mays]